MQLVKPARKYAASFKQIIAEILAEQEPDFWLGATITNLGKYLEWAAKNEQGADLPKNLVPMTTYWLVEDNEIIGRVDLRHCLTPALEKFGGHIGYAIRPSQRGSGYGTQMLRLALPKTKALGIEKALITCADTNTASQKMIEGSGGALQDKIKVDGVLTRRYWINLALVIPAQPAGW